MKHASTTPRIARWLMVVAVLGLTVGLVVAS